MKSRWLAYLIVDVLQAERMFPNYQMCQRIFAPRTGLRVLARPMADFFHNI
jgi:hypothetical protein